MKLWNIDNYVAFGDSLNDVEMFKHASFSICMGQGNSDLKRLSDFVTTSIDEDGIPIYTSLDTAKALIDSLEKRKQGVPSLIDITHVKN